MKKIIIDKKTEKMIEDIKKGLQDYIKDFENFLKEWDK